jgi:prolyl oligopeptidase
VTLHRLRAPAAALAAALAVAAPAAAQQPGPAAPIAATAQRVQYPPTRRGDQTDDYHGTRVADPYRWLEDLDGAETAAWVRAQNGVTTGYLDGTPGRDVIKQRLTAMFNYPRVGLPYREGGRLFFTKNTGLQKQSPYYTARAATAAGVAGAALVLDPNAISADGSTSLSMFAPDPSGRYVAYGLSEGAPTGARCALGASPTAGTWATASTGSATPA